MGLEFLVTTNTGWGRVHDGKYEPIMENLPVGCYGITWSRDTVFVVEKRPDGGGSEAQRSIARLLFLDRDLNEFDHKDFKGLKDCHQILYYDGYVYMTNTAQGRVEKVDPDSKKVKEHVQWRGLSPLSHVNSLFLHREKGYYACLHRKGTSQVVKLNSRFNCTQVWKIGEHIHNVYVEDGLMYICDSRNEALIEYNPKGGKVKRQCKIPRNLLGHKGAWFPRGLARGDGFFLVGLSKRLPRNARRAEQQSAVIKVNDDFELEEVFEIPDCGGITEVRLTSELDKAHNEIPYIPAIN